MTKTKPPVDPGRLLIGQMADMQRDLLSAIEEALQAEARGEDVADDLIILLQAAGWDRQRVQSERHRANRIVKFRAEAGTSAEREAARTAAERITRETVERRRELEAEIDRLNAELRGLQGAERDAVRKVEIMERAIERLRSDCPEHVKHEAAVRRNAARERIGKTINQHTDDIRRHGHLSALEGEELVDALKGNPETVHRCLTQSLEGGARIVYQLNHAAFDAFLDSLEVDRKREELPGLREQYDAALAEIDGLLNYYVED